MNTLVKTALLLTLLINVAFAKELDKVSLQLLWFDQFQFAGYYMAKEKGFYKDAGLDVRLKKFNYDLNVVDEVTSKRATYGVGRSSVIIDKSNGAKIKLLAAIFQTSPLVLLATESSGIKNFKDFKNKRVMTTPDTKNTVSLVAMMRKNGITENDIKSIEHAFSVDNLLAGKIDLMSAYISNEPYLLREKEIKYTIFDPKEYGFDLYSDILFTSADEINNHPQRAKRFREASMKGWEYAFSHIDESVALILKKYNALHKSKEALLYEVKELKKLAYYNLQKNQKIGYIDKNKVQRIYDMYNVLGFVHKEIDIDDFIVINDKNTLGFTLKEKNYIASHPIITYSEVNWKPLSIIENGKMSGILGDYLELVSKKTGIIFQYVPSKSWKEVLDKFQKKEIDIIPGIDASKDFSSMGLVSRVYKKYPMVIVTGKKFKFIDSLENLSSNIIAVPKYYTTYNYVKNNYPNIKVIATKNIPEALMLVESGKADAFVGHIATALYYTSKLHLADLKVSGRTKGELEHAFLIQNDEKLLFPILNKAIASITEQEKAGIESRWVNTIEEQKVDYALAWQLTLGFLVILFIVIYFLIKEHKLKRKINNLNNTLEEKVSRQVQEIQRQEQQLFEQSRLAQMGEMISMIAHQWRQPLTAISATVVGLRLKLELGSFDLETPKSKEEFEQYLVQRFDNIDKYVQHLTKTIDDFRNFYKPNKETKSIRLEEIMIKSLNIIKVSLESEGVEISYNSHSKKKIVVYDTELMQVVLNILKNAQDNFKEKAIKNPKLLIEVDDREITITDNGGGIAEDIIEKIFDPYFSTKGEKNGTGLGLYMSKTIVEEHHHGKLEVFNVGNGVCFKITL